MESRSGARYFLKDGEVPYDEKDIFVQDDLAELLSHDWKLLAEITIDDVPKIEGEEIDFKFKMIVVQLFSL